MSGIAFSILIPDYQTSGSLFPALVLFIPPSFIKFVPKLSSFIWWAMANKNSRRSRYARRYALKVKSKFTFFFRSRKSPIILQIFNARRKIVRVSQDEALKPAITAQMIVAKIYRIVACLMDKCQPLRALIGFCGKRVQLIDFMPIQGRF